MQKMAKTWINIEDNIKIINEVLDKELDTIDNQDKNDVFCIDDESKYQNDLLIVPEEENIYTGMEVMDCFNKMKSYLKKNDTQHRDETCWTH